MTDNEILAQPFSKSSLLISIYKCVRDGIEHECVNSSECRVSLSQEADRELITLLNDVHGLEGRRNALMAQLSEMEREKENQPLPASVLMSGLLKVMKIDTRLALIKDIQSALTNEQVIDTFIAALGKAE